MEETNLLSRTLMDALKTHGRQLLVAKLLGFI